MKKRIWLFSIAAFAAGLAAGSVYGFSVSAAGGAARFWLSRDWALTAEAAANVAQTIALIAAGWWTYRLFVRQRHDRVRANLTHAIVVLGRIGDLQLLRVEVTVQNIGNVVFSPPKGQVKLYQVVPFEEGVTSCFDESANSDELRATPMACEYPWRRIAKRAFALGPESMILEPGESDYLACDFCIPATVQAIFVRSEVASGDVESPDQHWHNETFHRLSNPAESTAA
jgi:hypothetical protein